MWTLPISCRWARPRPGPARGPGSGGPFRRSPTARRVRWAELGCRDRASAQREAAGGWEGMMTGDKEASAEVVGTHPGFSVERTPRRWPASWQK